MIPKKHWLQNYQVINGGKVLLGNDYECKVLGVGDVRLRQHDGSHRTLFEVRYVPELKRNLISFGELDRSSLKFKGEGGILKISEGLLACMKVILQNGIYFLQVTTLSGEAAVVSSSIQNQARLWHLRMSHISEQGLKNLPNKEFWVKDRSLN